jgi:hypothetical protein
MFQGACCLHCCGSCIPEDSNFHSHCSENLKSHKTDLNFPGHTHTAIVKFDTHAVVGSLKLMTLFPPFFSSTPLFMAYKCVCIWFVTC